MLASSHPSQHWERYRTAIVAYLHWILQIPLHGYRLSGSDTHQGTSPTPSSSAQDIAAFEEFARQYERGILNFLWRFTGNEQTAFDLAQEVFLRAWTHFATIRAYENPRAWLFRVATNMALNHRREHNVTIIPLDPMNETSQSDPGSHIVESEVVRQTLLKLPEKRRAALILRDVYGFSIAEIATILGMSKDATKMQLYRAREQFRVAYLREEEQCRG